MFEMTYKGYSTKIMRAARLSGPGIHTLPPRTPVDVYPVDSFEQPLNHWMKGQGNYVVPVSPDWGLWFDWTRCDELNTAILPTIKGMNPITGQRTNGFSLERYEEKCPVHNEQFKDGLYCEKCDMKWPKQNYVSHPNTLWWDGFRTSDGVVRQFFFTEDLQRSIPELVIGKEDTVPAFGFAFYSPKVKQIAKYSTTYKSHTFFKYSTHSSNSLSRGFSSQDIKTYYTSSVNTGLAPTYYCSSFSSPTISSDSSRLEETQVLSNGSLVSKDVGVGAGAEIGQDLKVDILKLSDWNSEPDCVMRLYFVFHEQFNEIKKFGMKDLSGKKEGFLDQLPVG